MNSPCNTCKYCKEVKDEFRTILTCMSEEKKKLFHYDDYWHDHTCKGHSPREQCLSCENYGSMFGYCYSCKAKCEGICVDYKKRSEIKNENK